MLKKLKNRITAFMMRLLNIFVEQVTIGDQVF